MDARLALKTAGTLSLALLLSLGCGGGAAAGEGAEPATAHSKKASSAKDDASGSTAEAEEEDDAPATSPCADGTCTTCGKGICPAGFFCDESAKGGAACSWLPQCNDKASCSCLTKAMGPGCKCQESAGGLHVSCG